MLYNSWEATGFDVDEASQLALAERAAALGVELFVVDDGWFGARSDDRAGLGDWTPDPERFPDGLGRWSTPCTGSGCASGSGSSRRWSTRTATCTATIPTGSALPGRPRTRVRNQLVLNFARPEVVDWAYGC